MEENHYKIDLGADFKKRDISYKIKVFKSTMEQLILRIKNTSKTLSKQIIGSNNLLNEMMLEKGYSRKIMQLYDRIGMLEDSRKLLDEDIKSFNFHIIYFFKEIQNIFVYDSSKINNINIKEYNSNIEYKTLFNNNYIEQGNNQINLLDKKFFNINDFHYKNKSRSNIKTNYEKYINSQNRIKNNNSSFKQSTIEKTDLENNNIFNNDSNLIKNKYKKSRNIKLNKSNHPSINIENTFNTISAKKNYKSRFNNISPTNKIINKKNENYSTTLAKSVIRFLNLIKEMKTKYNNKASINNLEFKKVKLLYDKLKIYIMNLSKKVIYLYSNNNQIKNRINNLKQKENFQIKDNNKNNHFNIVNNNSIKLLETNKENLLTENMFHFCYIKSLENERINIISKEISFNIINKINNFMKDISQIHENELIIVNENLEKKDYNSIIEELQEKIKTLTDELTKYKTDIDTENKNEESKADKEQIEMLLNENQELKNQIEEYKDSNNISLSNSKDELEKYYKDIINENESKIKFLTEQNKFYENEVKKYKENTNKENLDIANLKIENSKIQKENEDIKKENHILNQKIKEYQIKNNLEEIIPDKYDIICDKNFEKLCWILLRQKDGEKNKYESYIWIEKDMINNLDKFNFLKEEESINRQIMNYVAQIEEKENIIFKLKQKLNKYEKMKLSN